MTDADLYAQLSDIFRDAFFRDDIQLAPETTAADILGWDSHKQIEILMLCEEVFGFQFTSREIDGLHSVGDLATVIRERRAG